MTTIQADYFSKSVVRHFTEGKCYSLALAVNQTTGWRFAGVLWPRQSGNYGCEGEDYAWQHVLCRTPEGYYIDIRGIHTPAALRKQWGAGVKTARSQGRVQHNLTHYWGGTRVGSKARRYADAVVALHRGDPSPRLFTREDHA